MRKLTLAQRNATVHDFRRAFVDTRGSGVMVSIDPLQYTDATRPADVRIDGSASILRRDASWRLWTDHGNVFHGYAWAPGTSTRCIRCAAPIDAKTVYRTRTFLGSEHDRCGETGGAPWLRILATVAAGTVVGVYDYSLGSPETARGATTRAVGVATIGLLVVWFAAYMDASTWVAPMERTHGDTSRCVQQTLAAQRALYGPTSGETNVAKAGVTVAATALSYQVLGTCTSLPSGCTERYVAAMATGIATLVTWQLANGQTIAPFRRGGIQNEFVMFPRAGVDGLALTTVAACFPPAMPSHLVIVAFDGSPPRGAQRTARALQRLFDGDTPLLHITYRHAGSVPQFRFVCPLRDAVAALQRHCKSPRAAQYSQSKELKGRQ